MAGLSAVLVIAVGVLIAERFEPRRSAMPLAATPLPALVLPAEESGRAAVVASAAPMVAAAPVASAAPMVAAATIASAAAPAAPAAGEGGDPASLPADRGYLVLGGAGGARAYVNGADVGAADQRIAVACGARYVRLGTAAEKGRPPSWLTAGRSVVVACRGETRLVLAP